MLGKRKQTTNPFLTKEPEDSPRVQEHRKRSARHRRIILNTKQRQVISQLRRETTPGASKLLSTLEEIRKEHPDDPAAVVVALQNLPAKKRAARILEMMNEPTAPPKGQQLPAAAPAADEAEDPAPAPDPAPEGQEGEPDASDQIDQGALDIAAKIQGMNPIERKALSSLFGDQ